MAIKHVVTRGFIGSGSGVFFVPTAGFTSSTEVIVSGPFCVVVQQAFLAGAVLAEGYTAGAVIAEDFTAGSNISDQVC